MSNKQDESLMPNISDNMLGDVVDSLSTGFFATIIMKLLFEKNMSVKNMFNTNTLKDGLKMGGCVAAYRRVGRPIVNAGIKRAGFDDAIKI